MGKGEMQPGGHPTTGQGDDSIISSGAATTGKADFPPGGGETPAMTGSTVNEHTLPQPDPV